MTDPARIAAPQAEGPALGPDDLAALIARPGFDDAMMRFAERVVAEYRASWVMNRLFSDRGRLMAFFMALDLYFADSSRRGFTLEELRREAARYGFASPGRITAWAASLRLVGLFAAVGAGRPQRLAPTERFIGIFRTRMRNLWQSIAPIHPPAKQAMDLLEREDFVAQLPAGFMQPYRAGQRLFGGVPELADVGDREAG